MEIDRRAFIASLGGAAAVALMDHEAKAEALEHYMEDKLDEMVARPGQPGEVPDRRRDRSADRDAPLPARHRRRVHRPARQNVKKLEPMPEKPTLQDFFRLRFAPANHVLQSATRAMKTGMSEEIILACLLHDCVLSLIKPDHGWWGAQLFEPYIPEKSDVRDPLSPDAALLPGRRTPATSTRISTTGSSATTTRRRSTSRTPTRC